MKSRLLCPRRRPLARSSRQGAGFTLIELLVVLAIVATLLMIVAPRHWGQVDHAKEAVLRDNLRGLRTVIDQFHADRGRYPESLQELVDQRYLRAIPLDPLTGLATTWVLVPPPDGQPGAVADLHSGASGTDRDGTPYAQW
jgi:general secretion pathway protein G